MLLEIRESRIANITVLELSGRLAMGQESQQIDTVVDGFTRRGDKHVIFDLTRVSYIDSAGLAMLGQAAGKLREKGGLLLVVAPPDGRTTHLLKLTQLNSILALHSTLEDARAALA